VKIGDNNNVMVENQHENGLESDFPAANLTKSKERKREKYSKACPIRIESSPCHHDHHASRIRILANEKEKAVTKVQEYHFA
jgi:hypothetical protein